MLITLSVPDNTTAIFITQQSTNDHGYTSETEPEKITFDMIVKVEQEQKIREEEKNAV